METIRAGDHPVCPQRLPPWFLRRPSENERMRAVKRLMRELHLHTVCQSAGCPNLPECFDRLIATFLILGDRCTRRCRFCGVSKGIPLPPDPDEPGRVAAAVRILGLRHVVVTSVTRDDLADGGADAFAAVTAAVRRECAGTAVEVLVPDFGGNERSLTHVLGSAVDVLAHNVETVPRLYPEARPGADFNRSLRLLRSAREAGSGVRIKSGLMLGLGETENEVGETLRRLADAGCDMVCMGQYLRPNLSSLPVAEYIRPERFDRMAAVAKAAGIPVVIAGPQVRSSYHADQAVACR
ncbi:lipoyl synthase [bacterium]|nr:lipoyl synthase [bacterium]